jgi:hypothetical protein
MPSTLAALSPPGRDQEISRQAATIQMPVKNNVDYFPLLPYNCGIPLE